jgi:hypothetical protein
VRFTLPLSITFAASILCTESSLSQNLIAPSASGDALAYSNIASVGADLFGLNPVSNRGDSLHQTTGGISYAPFRGGLTDATILSAGFCYYSSEATSSIGLSFSRLGFQDIFSDETAVLSLVKEFSLAEGRKAYAGIRGRYERVAFTNNYDPLDFWLFDLGFQLAVTNEFYLAGTAQDLLGANYTIVNSSTEELPRIFSIGISYVPRDLGLSIYTSLEKQTEIPMFARFGVEYALTKQIALRAGTTSLFTDYRLGIGLIYDPIVFDAALLAHSETGISASFALSIGW